MRVLIVESNAALAQAWAEGLRLEGCQSTLATGQDAAVAWLRGGRFAAMVLDLRLDRGAALAVADYAAYRWPQMPVLFVSDEATFADGSIFNHCPNACGFLRASCPAQDLAALVAYHAAANRQVAAE